VSARALVLVLVLAGCTRPSGPPVGVTLVPVPDPAPPHEPHPAKEAEPPADIVARSALPITGVRVSDGATLTATQLFDELSRYEAVCIGESHDDPHHHYAELALLEELARRSAHRGEQLGVGFEMFQAPFQGALDAFAHGQSDEAALLEHSEYAERWGFPFAFYRPLLEAAREHGLPLVALNARRELTRSVARRGLAGVPPELQPELPELDMENAAHRQNFERMMQEHPGHGSLDNYYAAQVVWDETMAQRAAVFLAAGRPSRKLMIVAGLAHCTQPAVPGRLQRRSAAKTVSVMPSVGVPANTDSYDYALVMTPGE
jgi:uncharacterized iron-regulated protein